MNFGCFKRKEDSNAEQPLSKRNSHNQSMLSNQPKGSIYSTKYTNGETMWTDEESKHGNQSMANLIRYGSLGLRGHGSHSQLVNGENLELKNTIYRSNKLERTNDKICDLIDETKQLRSKIDEKDL